MKLKVATESALEVGQTVAFNFSGEVRRGKIIEINEAPWRKKRPSWKTPESFEREYPNEYRWLVFIQAEGGQRWYPKLKPPVSVIRNTKGILVIFEL